MPETEISMEEAIKNNLVKDIYAPGYDKRYDKLVTNVRTDPIYNFNSNPLSIIIDPMEIISIPERAIKRLDLKEGDYIRINTKPMPKKEE